MDKNQRQPRSLVKVVADSRGYLRLQFSTSISREIWGKTQYYKALGLIDSEDNRIKAGAIASQIEIDVKFGKLDASLDKYSVVTQAGKNAENTHNYYGSKLTLLELYEKYIEYLKPQKAETTFIRKFVTLYGSTLSKCPQDLKQSAEIQAKIVQLRCPQHAKNLLGTLFDAIEWAKIINLVPEDFPNPYKFYQEKIPAKKHPTKQLPAMITKTGIITPKFKYRGYLPEEIPFILEALSRRGDYRNKGQWVVPVEMLFLTGFRLGEAAALRWKNVDKDFEFIYVCESYEPDFDIFKETKTGQTRYFPCNQQVKDFLSRIKPANAHPDYFVTGGERPVNFNRLNQVWAGQAYPGDGTNKSTQVSSVISKLMAEGKVENYYPPYGARHTWINIQLKAGVPVQNVAEWAGNSPQTIWKNYVSYDSRFSEPAKLPVITDRLQEAI